VERQKVRESRLGAISDGLVLRLKGRLCRMYASSKTSTLRTIPCPSKIVRAPTITTMASKPTDDQLWPGSAADGRVRPLLHLASTWALARNRGRRRCLRMRRGHGDF